MAITKKIINLEQLDKELGGFGLCSSPLENGELLITIAEHSTISEADLVKAIESHKAVFPPSPLERKAALLERLGITEEEAKLLLG